MLTNQTSETKMMLDRDLSYWNTCLFHCVAACILNLLELNRIFVSFDFCVEMCMFNEGGHFKQLRKPYKN